ncbi:beta-1,6-glucan boisynthesis protein [Histoplasma capsulatum var. duboisii H88]|uniref:Beta-1,6-glucan boisynthesis protein n=2 Tax=Ajellomyces capsulatus TaxID=5037 RepID=F0U9F6_AJEC8|nr:beta-1,6-glucan boisynthesis protein [Histoplasma capsulatum H143]EGC41898.1 beta-1,6-glucan boisynthesis protein [Histoplasma capsulatum var. duboisii H88]QSS51691.1 beta-1,6-glucan boisynthesis protein [Histoplasma capsulatum var. duboisii H88]
MKTRILLPLTQLVLAASASIEFTAPAAGAVLKGGDTLVVEWQQLWNNSDVSDGTRFDIFLCAGGNHEDSYGPLIHVAKDRSFAQGNSISFPLAAGIGGNEPNAYFLQMVINNPNGLDLFHSPRFTLIGMTGNFPGRLLDGIKAISGVTDSPPVHYNQLGKRQANLPYGLQTGPTRYAPMAKQPPTKITLRTASPQYPQSPFHIAKTYLPPPSVQTTLTAKATFKVASIENTAAPAPVDDEIQRYLNRWKD